MEGSQSSPQAGGKKMRAILLLLSILLGASLAFNMLLLYKNSGKAVAAPVLEKAAQNAPQQAAQRTEPKLFYDGKKMPLVLKSAKQEGQGVEFEFLCAGSLIAQSAKVSCSPSVTNAKLTVNGSKFFFSAALKAGKTYKFTIKKGLSDTQGNSLAEDTAVQITFTDRSPELEFATSGLYLPSKPGPAVLPFKMVNAPKLNVTVDKAYNNNLNPFYDSYHEDSKMYRVLEKELEYKNIPANQDIVQELNLTELLKNSVPGVYKVTLSYRSKEGCLYSTSCRAIITDIGIQAVADPVNRQILVNTSSLHLNTPLAGVEITVWSDKNQLVARGQSGSDGSVLLKYDPAWRAKDDSVVAVIARKNDDLCYFRLNNPLQYQQEPELDIRRPKAFLFTERGICRPGESFSVSGFARIPVAGQSYTTPLKSAAVRYKLYSPQGKLIEEFQGKTDAYGFYRTQIQIPVTARTGLWRIAAHINGSEQKNGETSIHIGSYIPDALKVKARCLTNSPQPDQPVAFEFDARYYFGAPLLDGSCRYTVDSRLAPRPKHWDSCWHIGIAENFTVSQTWSSSSNYDGKAQKITYPGWSQTGGKSNLPVLLCASAAIASRGGRTTIASTETVLHPFREYIGLRHGKTKESVSGSCVVECTLIPAEKDQPVSVKNLSIQAQLSLLEWEYVLKKQADNRYVREWEQREYPLPDRNLKLLLNRGNIGKICWKNLPPGLYRVDVTSASGQMSRLEFWHSAGSGGGHPVDRNRIVFSTDKPLYVPGEKVSFTFTSPGAGNARIVCGEDGIDQFRTMAVKKGKNQFAFTLPAKLHSTSFFAGVTIITHDESGDLLRLFGVLELKIDQQSNKLHVALKMPAIALPGAKIPIELRLADAAGKGQAGAAAIYGVDSGIVSLTDYRCPDIFGFFHGRQPLPLGFYDLYGEIYPKLKLLSNGKIGGDAGGKLVQIKQKESVRVILPLVAIPPSGILKTNLTMPDHNGAMNFYAVAVSDKKIGSAEAEIVLRKKLSIRINAPQILAPGDQCEVTVSMFNHDEDDSRGSCTLTLPPQLTAAEGEKLQLTGISIPKGKQKTVVFRLKGCEKYGAGVVKAEYTSGKSKAATYEYLTIRPLLAAQTRTRIHLLNQGKSLTISPGKEFIGKTKGKLRLSNTVAAGVPGALEWLNHYPYGCLEQTTAGAFPLLFADEMQKSQLIDPLVASTAKAKISSVYRSILPMSLMSGGFGMWEFDTRPWHEGSIFALHFIFEAVQRKLITLTPKQKERYCSYLQKIQSTAFDLSRKERAEAAYVLALAGDSSAAVFARNILMQTEKPDYATFLAGAALVRANYASAGAAALRDALNAGCWNSTSDDRSEQAKHLGMTMKILHDCCWQDRTLMTRMALQLGSLQKADNSGWGTTSANAWASAGLAIYAADDPPGKITVEMQNRQIEISGIREFTVDSQITIKNCSGGTLIAEWIEQGIPRTPDAPGPIKISRCYKSADGKEVKNVAHGDLLTAEIRIESPVEITDLVVADLLPGGLEIEDSRIGGRSSIIREKGKNLLADRIEKRPDRFLLFGSMDEGKACFTYKVRAVSRGKFKIPPVTAESMYHPELKGISSVSSQELVIR